MHVYARGVCIIITFSALDPNLAAHELHKGLGHRQAQPAAAVLLRDPTRLREYLQEGRESKLYAYLVCLRVCMYVCMYDYHIAVAYSSIGPV